MLPSRWIYGLPGVWLAETFAFTPVAFLVLIGVVNGVTPSRGKGSQTLRGGRGQTFSRISLPLMCPGLANAFLVEFIESIAFSIVGARIARGHVLRQVGVR